MHRNFLQWSLRHLLGERTTITDGRSYMESRYGETWRRVRKVTLRGFYPQLMSEYPSRQHCSLASVTALIDFYARRNAEKERKNNQMFSKTGVFGVSSLAGTSSKPRPGRHDIFEVVSRVAYRRLLSSPKLGTFPWNIAEIVRRSFAEFGQETLSRNRFFFWSNPKITRLLINEINHGRPALVSFSHNQYFSHTVTAFGYEEYINTENPGQNRKKWLLIVADNWSRSPRLVDLTRVGDWRDTFLAICQVKPL